MPRTDVTIRTQDGTCAATLHTPSSTGSGPAVIIYPDAGGVRETLAVMADRLAGLEYAVLLPDLFRATVYVAAAENDSAFPPEQYERLQRAFVSAGVRHTIDTYPAAHGFAVPDNPTYDAKADQRHWTALTELYAENLHT